MHTRIASELGVRRELAAARFRPGCPVLFSSILLRFFPGPPLNRNNEGDVCDQTLSRTTVKHAHRTD